MPFEVRARRLVPALLAALLVTSLAAPVHAAPTPALPGTSSTPGRADEGTAPRFPDVPEGHPFATAVEWAAAAGLVEGYPDGTFGPTAPVTRQSLAAILHRMAGSPAPEGDGVGFSDVADDHPFATEIAWMHATGLAEGYEDGTYRPGAPASRQAVAAVLQRFHDAHGTSTPRAATFSDVGDDHPFAGAIAWLTGTGAAAGYADGTFRPATPTSRQAAVSFLHALVEAGLLVDPTVPEPEWFEGSVADFYVVPEDLRPAPPGTLIRLQHVTGEPATVTSLRIMYHSRDAQGRDRAVTGTITYPNAPAPEGGWPVFSQAPGTVGLASHCALSRNRTVVGTYGIQGVGVATDYIGMGPVGELQAYLSRDSQAHSVIDAVRAARSLPDAGAGDRWFTIGGSQGGHGALVAGELADAYAPELDLLGVVSHAPAAMFHLTYNPIDVVVTRVVTVMAIYGAATEHDGIDPADYLAPEAQALVEPAIATGCRHEIIEALGPVVASPSFWLNDPATTEPFATHMRENDAGLVAHEAPVLVLQGTEDVTVFPARTDDLVDRLCGIGQVTEYVVLPGTDHGWWGTQGDAHVHDWLRDRLDGAAAPNTCPSGG